MLYVRDASTHDFLDLDVSPRDCARLVRHGQKPLTTNLQLLKRPTSAVSSVAQGAGSQPQGRLELTCDGVLVCLELPRGVIDQSDLVRGVPLLIGDENDEDVFEGAVRVSSEESSSVGC